MDKQRNINPDEQQLKAAYQQLQASEQQLKAANQQLQAANRQLRATEEELRESRERYKRMFESTINAIAVYEAVDNGEDFIVRNLNPSAEVLEKIKKENVLGKSVLEALPAVGVFGLFDVFKRVWRTGEPEHFPETIQSDGRIVGWRENYVFKLPTGEVVAVYKDITEQRRAAQMQAEEHNLLRTLIDNLPDSVYVKDMRSRFVICNAEVARRMGVTAPDKIIGKTDSDFHPKHLASKYHADEQEVIRSGRSLINREERVIDQTTGRVIWNLTTKVPWRDSQGKIVGIVGIGRDITKRKAAEEAFKAATQQLQASEMQLRAANQQLNASNQQLRASEQQLKAANQQLNASNQQLRASEQQLKAANQQLQAGEQQLRAANQQLRASEGELRKLNHELRQRVKELDCLHGLSRLDEQRDIPLQQIFQELLGTIPAAWQYPEIAAVRIGFEGRMYKTDNFRETDWIQSADIRVYNQKAGAIEVCYLEERPAADEGPFLQEERNLLEDLAERLGDIAERKQAERRLLDYQGQLKSLASQLSLSEERERHRLATELHDRISQFLVISKVKLEALRQSADSTELAKALGEVCNSLGQTIENTRSLTFDLSSPILYELGFEAAVVEWLAEQIQKKHGIATEFKDDHRSKPLDEDIRVLLFRDVRELLINVVKHARASKVKVSVRRVDEEVQVSVEDDGVGFDVTQIEPVPTKTGGFGLFSIRERLEQVGGRLEIDSKPGKGSRVTVIAPLKDKKDKKGREK